jgi:hypothetical protein
MFEYEARLYSLLSFYNPLSHVLYGACNEYSSRQIINEISMV